MEGKKQLRRVVAIATPIPISPHWPGSKLLRLRIGKASPLGRLSGRSSNQLGPMEVNEDVHLAPLDAENS